MRKMFLSCLMVSIMAMPALAGLNFPNIDVKGDLSFKSITADKYLADENVDVVEGTETITRTIPDSKMDNVHLTADLKLSAELADNVELKAVLRNESIQNNGDNDDLFIMQLQTKVYQAYLNVKDIAGVDAVVGRQNIGEKKNALVLQLSSVDAVTLSKKCGPVDVAYVSANGP
ncbi:MAG: hypothetical protein AAB296_06700, partial [Candidatus Desantisbacteria bacterium]